MEPRTKGVIAAVILMVAIPAVLATILTQTRYGEPDSKTSVTVYCGWGGGEVRVDVLVPTTYVNELDGQGLIDLNDEICDSARETLNEALGEGISQ